MKIKFRYIMLLTALSVAGCAAYFSVWGLSQLFAGASLAVILMASVLELGKLVVTTALHTYWDKFAKPLRAYLAISVVILMIITSAGIYGFLSNAYQKTANKLEIHEGELGILDSKKAYFQKGIDANKTIIDTKTKRMEQLSNLRNNQEIRIDGSKSNRDKNSVRGDIASANSEIQKLSIDIDELNAKNAVLSDSIGKYDVKSLEKKSTSDVAGEVGPLKYVSELTGAPMGKIVNYMILLLIFVFDPLAIALVLATNKAFDLAGVNTPLEPKLIEEPEVIEEEIAEEEIAEEEIAEEPIYEEPIYEEPIYGEEIDYEEFPNEDEDELIEEVIEEPEVIEEITPEPEVIKEITPEPEVMTNHPITSSNKIVLEDIKEIRERKRGYSVDVPDPKYNNSIQRIRK